MSDSTPTGTPPIPPPAIPTTTATFPVTGAFPKAFDRHRVEAKPVGKRLAILSLTALGVVYGDIGTSPLYALKECFGHTLGLEPTPANVYGVLSLIVWSLMLVVSFKYILYIMRADNEGEGGILALLALIHRRMDAGHKRAYMVLTTLGLFGAALLYGDGVITPAISVLGAVEGLEVASPLLVRVVVPLSLVILALLFAVQRLGTDRIGKVFGPIMLVWFAAIGALGVMEIAREPRSSARSTRCTARDSSRTTASSASSCWAPWCSPSPAPKRCTPTWDTSAGGRSARRGSASCSPRCC